MLAPVLMTFILVLPYLFARFAMSGPQSRDLRPAAAAGVGLVFLFAASGHFLQTGPMVQMLPPWVPEREFLVYATGVLEIAIAISMFFSRSRRTGALAAAATLVAFFPANVYAAMHQVPMGGHAWGLAYLWVRAPLQIFILWWIWAMVLRDQSKPPLIRHTNAK